MPILYAHVIIGLALGRSRGAVGDANVTNWRLAWVAGCGASVFRRVLELSLSVGVWGGVPKLGRDLVPRAPIYFRVYAEVYLAQRHKLWKQTQMWTQTQDVWAGER